MALENGAKLGPYEIVSPLGAGGMGEVYRARDSRLSREVAIKVLPGHLSDDADLRARFEREARSISNLQHPNICVLYDVGQQDGLDYLVMEYLEGETLGQRLTRGPLPLEQVLKIGVEVAGALEGAHRHGIVHRDLKPGNIMLTKTGAKLMDFGLAKSHPLAGARGGVSSSLTPSTPTLNLSQMTGGATPLTQKGAIVGTFQYMAPEVLQGAEADARSDNFSFGCVLYEMMTGKRAFDGKSQVGVLAAILERDPEPISATQPLTPPALERLVRMCLAKDPDERWQSAHDLRVQLQAIAEMGSQAGVPAAVASTRQKRGRWVTVAAAVGWVAAAACLVAAFVFARHASEAKQITRAEIELPAESHIDLADHGSAAFSPDGRELAFPAFSGNGFGLFVRDLESGKTTRLEGVEDAIFPFWSADSRNIGFFSGGKLRKVAAAGGPVQIVADAPAGRGGTWGTNGMIVFTPNTEDALYKVPETGGTPVAITKLGKKGFSHRNPWLLPDGKHVLFTVQAAGAFGGDLAVGSLDGDEPRTLLQQASNGMYSGGYLFYVKDRNLMAQRFDTGVLEARGSPLPIADNVDFWNGKDLGDFAVSATGSLVYQSPREAQFRMAWLSLPKGAPEEFGEVIDTLRRELGNCVLSRDGRKIVITRHTSKSPDADTLVYDFDRKTLSRQTVKDPGTDSSAAFSPDGRTLALAEMRGVNFGLVLKSLADGSEQAMSGAALPGWTEVDDWTPDGKFLIVNEQAKTGVVDMYAVPLAGGPAVPLMTAAYRESGGTASPNGKWMAYDSTEPGRQELFVTDLPGVHAKLQISTEGAGWHDWSHDGRKLYFTNDGKLFVVEMKDPNKLEFGNVQLVTTLDELVPVGVAPDGRLLVLKQVNAGRQNPFHLVVNAVEALEKAGN